MRDEYLPGWENGIAVSESEGVTEVRVNGRLYMKWERGNSALQRIAIAQLNGCGLASREELAEAFDLSVRSVQRYAADFTRQGLDDLVSRRRGPRSRWKVTPDLRAKILVTVLKDGVSGLNAIRERLEEVWNERVSLATIREVLLENGLLGGEGGYADAALVQGELFRVRDGRQRFLDFDWDDVGIGGRLKNQRMEREDRGTEREDGRASCTRRSRSCYSPAQREYLDRLEQGDYNTYAGGLLYAPLLERYRFMPILKRLIKFETHEGYSLGELCFTLFYFDVFSFRSMEDFKRAYPEEFGCLIGRSYSPSLFTLRRFLHKVRELEIGEEMVEGFAVEYLKAEVVGWGVLYIDGHFFPYYGAQPIRKGWHGVRRTPMKGSYHFLGVDDKFSPWLFLVRSSSEDLLEKIPEMVEKARRIGREAGLSEEETARLVVIFDREGYSAKLYRLLDGKEEGSEIPRTIFVTWAKYADKWVNDIPEESFDKEVTVGYEIQEPEKMKCFETKRMMNKYGNIRAVVIQSGEDGKRAAIYTNGTEEELTTERVVQLICRRWGQENAIKELMMKHLINYMPGYVFEEMEDQPMVDNPKVKKLKKKKAKKASELHKLKVDLADKILGKGREAIDWEKMKTGDLETLAEISRVDNEMLAIREEVERLPAQIRFDEAHDGERMVRLNYEKKRFLDCIKVFGYNVRGEMCKLLLNHYDAEKELLPALRMIVERGGFVKLERERLMVRLRRFANREIDYAARHLCEDLNAMRPVTTDRFHFPIHYEVG